MRFGTALLATCAVAGLTACSPGGAASAPPVAATTATASAGLTPTASPTPEVAALGGWTATCSSPDADGAALVRNLSAQAPFKDTATPSAAAGWSDAVAAAVKPLDQCQTAHLLAVAEAVDFADDKQAEASASARIIALAKGRTLLLTGTHVGRIAVGTPQSDASPVLTAIMGKPKTSAQSCELSGESWNVLAWGDFHVSFIKSGKGAVLDSWGISPKGNTAPNLKLPDDLPLRATFAQLKASQPGLVLEDVFGTGGGPWVAEVRPDLRYVWIARSGQSFNVEGGNQRGCE